MDDKNTFSLNPIPFSLGSGIVKKEIKKIITNKTKSRDQVLFIVDKFFQSSFKFNFSSRKIYFYYLDSSEPTTDGIQNLMRHFKSSIEKPKIIFGIGGGVVLDTAKAISNLYNNPGNPSKYQGWDLLNNPGIYKVGIPTISGTGAEASRTCVLINSKTGLKLGMNSNFTYFDYLILDYGLTKSVPKNLFFQTLSDAYFHAMELIEGRYRNEIADDYALLALRHLDEIFKSNRLKSDLNRRKAMLASYYAGFAISLSMVGLVHPVSASIGKVFDIPHTKANLLAFKGVKEFYKERWKELNSYFVKHDQSYPTLDNKIDKSIINNLINLTIVHEKPLSNMLGPSYKRILNKAKLINIFESI